MLAAARRSAARRWRTVVRHRTLAAGEQGAGQGQHAGTDHAAPLHVPAHFLCARDGDWHGDRWPLTRSAIDHRSGTIAGTGPKPASEIGRAHVWTPVNNAHLACRL